MYECLSTCIPRHGTETRGSDENCFISYRMWDLEVIA